MMAFVALLMMILTQSSAFLISHIRYRSIRSRVLQKVEGFLSKDTSSIITSRHCSSSIYTSRRDTTADHEQKQTALLWLSTNRLRIRDNLALCKAAELGTDELTICICWPYDISKANSIHELTPVQAFGYAALHSLNNSLAEFGQKLWLVPTRGCSGDSDDMVSIMAKTTKEVNPSHVVMDVSLLDRHCNYTSKLRDKVQSILDDNTITYTPNVVEVFDDDGLLIPFDRVSKALGRSRMGGRALRWSTFLSNTIPERDEYDKPTMEISSLPSPLADTTISTSISIPKVESFPSWAKQLLIDWGDVSEDEAILRASSINRSIERSSSNNREMLESEQTSSLTERGSINTKLSPYLRYGLISPQRAAKAGVRRRDILWRDWSYICYGLLGPIRRGEAVLEFMDKSCHSSDGNKDEKFKLWCVGNTGSPLVDASMRQLWSEGWIPRRLRLLTAACLVEGLGLDWRLGRDWFQNTLIDHDPAINEIMWQNSGLCGVDPWYRGVKWEEPPSNESDEKYVQYWMNRQLTWPPTLEAHAIQESPPQIIKEAESKREALRTKGVYKAAKTTAASGIRVAWPGLKNKQSIKEGEVMGVGATPVSELSI